MKCAPYPADPRYIGYEDGRVWSTISKRFLKPRKTRFGYLIIKIRDKTKRSRQRNVFVHRIIASCLLTNNDPKNKKYCHHRNSKRDDNRVENLEWVTASQNHIYKFKSGYTFKPGQKKSGVVNYSLYHFKNWIGDIPANATFTGYWFKGKSYDSLRALGKDWNVCCQTASTWFKKGKVRYTLNHEVQPLNAKQKRGAQWGISY